MPAPAPEPFEVLSEPAQLTLIAGSAAQLSAQVNDTNGRPIGGASLDFEALDPKLLRVSASGEVTSLGPAGRGAIRITSGAREVEVPVSVIAGSPHRIEVTSEPASVMAGHAAESRVVARVLDSFGNPVSRTALSFEIGGDSARVLTAESDGRGEASIFLPSLLHAGRATLRVHTAGEAPVEVTQDFLIAPSAVAALVPVEYPAGGIAAPNDELDIALRVVDAYANPVPDIRVQWNPGARSGSVEPQETQSGPDGVVRTRWSLRGATSRNASLHAGHDSITTEIKITVRAAGAKRGAAR